MGMLIGVNCNRVDYVSHFGAALHGARLCRVFCAPGEAIIDWSDQRLAALPATIAPHLSFHDWPSDTAVRRALNVHLDAMPVHLTKAPLLPEIGCSYVLTYLHEVEPKAPSLGLTPAEYQRRYGVLTDVVRSHPLGHLVAIVPIQTLQWTDAHTVPGHPKGDGNPFAWWAGTGDFAGIDCYAGSWASGYPKPGMFLRSALALSVGTGRRLWIPELGAVRLPNDHDGTARAAWIRAVLSLLDAAGAAAVSWWCAPGTGGKDFHLADEPSLQAWLDAIAHAGGVR